jgi:hypothetical protein
VEVSVIDALDRLVPRTMPLTEVCAWVEARLIEDLAGVVQRRADALARTQAKRFRAVAPDRFYFDDHLYEVRLTLDPLDVTIVHIGVVALGVQTGPRGQPGSLELSLEGLGRLTGARIWIDTELGALEETLGEDVHRHFAGGYRWLESHVVGELLFVEHRATVELYMEVRSHLASQLADLVALYGMNRRRAFYLLDPRAIQTALVRAGATRATLSSSPIELTALMTTRLLDPGETVSKASLVEDRALSLSLSESLYAPTGLNLAEGAFYETSQVMSMPLVREGRLQLTAVFPLELRPEIEPVLEKQRDRFGEVLQRNGKFSVERVIGRGRTLDGAVAPGDIAELLGRFTGGYVDSAG